MNILTEDQKKKKKLSSFPMKNKNWELKIINPNSNDIILYNKCFHSPLIRERYERHNWRNKFWEKMIILYLECYQIIYLKMYLIKNINNENYLSNFRYFLEIDFNVNFHIKFSYMK